MSAKDNLDKLAAKTDPVADSLLERLKSSPYTGLALIVAAVAVIVLVMLL